MNKGYSVTVEAVTHGYCLNKNFSNTCGKASVIFVSKKYIENLKTSFM